MSIQRRRGPDHPNDMMTMVRETRKSHTNTRKVMVMGMESPLQARNGRTRARMLEASLSPSLTASYVVHHIGLGSVLRGKP